MKQSQTLHARPYECVGPGIEMMQDVLSILLA